MSGPAANTNAENPENPDVTRVDTDGPPSPLDNITLPESGLDFGAGTLDYQPNPNTGGRGALGTNIPNNGGYNPEVQALQTYMAQQLDSEWDGNENGNTTALPGFGIDGVWRCETQTAFNNLLESKGIAGNLGSEKAQADAASKGCPPAYALDEKTLKALQDSDKKKKEDEDKEEADDAVVETPEFSDQCFLIENLPTIFAESRPPNPMPKFYDRTDPSSRKKIKYKNVHKVHTEDPGTMINRLKATKGAGEFLNIRHYQLSQLTPTIRIYKEYYESPEGAPKEVELKFRSFVDPEDDLQSMLNSELQRGVGVGIESFNFNFIGVQPATVKKDIEANLVVYAQNFNELFKTRQGEDQDGKPKSYRIIDLVLLEPKFKDKLKPGSSLKTRVFNPSFYRIKVNAGWAATGGGGLLSDDLTSAIKDNQVEMFLTLIDHRFDFQDDGSVRLSMQFRASLESYMLDKRSDVLFEPSVRSMREARLKTLNEISSAKSKLNEQGKNVCKDIDGEIAKLRKSYEQTIEREREESYLSLLKTLLAEGCIYTAVVKPDTEFPGYTYDVLNYSCDSEDFIQKPAIMKAGERKINFFYLGDLIALAVNNVLVNTKEQSTLPDKLNYGNVKFVLGPAPLDHLNSIPGPLNLKKGDIPSQKFMEAFNDEGLNMGLLDLNIADLPISVELYTDFMRDKVIKGRRNSYPLLVFIRQVIRELVFEALGPQCGSGDIKPNLTLATAQISADSGPGGTDLLGDKIGDKSALPLDEYAKNLVVPVDSESGGLFGRKNKNKNAKTKFVFDSFNRKPLDQSYEYFVIYPFYEQPKNLAFEKVAGGPSTRYERDLSNGLFHVSTGLDRGLTKTMNFDKTDQPYLREARFEQSDSNPELQLSNVYNARVTMYGNNLFFPGGLIYINPRGLGSEELGDPGVTNSKANIMGLGGYHMIKQVRHTIDGSGYNTNIEAMHITSGDGKGSVMENNARVGDTVIIECADLQDEIKRLSRGGAMDGETG